MTIIEINGKSSQMQTRERILKQNVITNNEFNKKIKKKPYECSVVKSPTLDLAEYKPPMGGARPPNTLVT